MSKIKVLTFLGILGSVMLMGSLMIAPAFAKNDKIGDKAVDSIVCHFSNGDDTGHVKAVTEDKLAHHIAQHTMDNEKISNDYDANVINPETGITYVEGEDCSPIVE